MPSSHFTRGTERLSCEHHEDGAGFLLTMSAPGGGSIKQRFSDLGSLMVRRLALERLLVAAGWLPETQTR